MFFSEDKRILEKIYKAWGPSCLCSPFPIENKRPKWKGQQKFVWILTEENKESSLLTPGSAIIKRIWS